MATMDDFKKCELKVAEIKEVKAHPNADRLYVLKVSLGQEERQIVAGIRNFYTPEELLGKRVIVIANLEPAVIRGEESQGMLLAAKDGTSLTFLTTQRDVALGSPVS